MIAPIKRVSSSGGLVAIDKAHFNKYCKVTQLRWGLRDTMAIAEGMLQDLAQAYAAAGGDSKEADESRRVEKGLELLSHLCMQKHGDRQGSQLAGAIGVCMVTIDSKHFRTELQRCRPTFIPSAAYKDNADRSVLARAIQAFRAAELAAKTQAAIADDASATVGTERIVHLACIGQQEKKDGSTVVNNKAYTVARHKDRIFVARRAIGAKKTLW